ncbi:hypothetical protein AAE02nite_03460 [Adhaeribacter aerolatus]|uniref:Uncharacterized protein n=1 Tax=Adhaeribacter aerolatus TaxID=670289 RepID=A0A512ASJ4_9BACT|nr:hypothetical protein [Adhaeribacter aerolatus]GEO02682.1 hypothetical protein AAE02nite_03460 [Adhaeribacter aerolatus]
MAYEKLIVQVQSFLKEGKTDEVVELLFSTYLQTHPEARNIQDFRERISYKLRNELGTLPENEAKEKAELLIFGFMAIVSNSEGETGYNIVLLLLHLMRRGQFDAIREIIQVLKLERASRLLERMR